MQIHPALFKLWCIALYKKHVTGGTSGPKPIALFPGETEIFRKGTVLVTDTRLTYIDPNDRMLKAYMFEHMISMHKHYYRATTLNHLFCKSLLIISATMLTIVLLIDIFKETSQTYTVVYIPILLGLFIGLLVWRDMKPRYTIQWKMRDGTTDKISTEPLFREWLRNQSGREEFMDGLTQAMNQALAGKSWVPDFNNHTSDNENKDEKTDASEGDENKGKQRLRLVTDNYQ